jgi:hypothetical protein
MNRVRPLLIMFGWVILIAVSGPAGQDSGKLLYADFETAKDNRPVSSRGGQIQLNSYQESPTLKSKYKGLEGANPPCPELVRIKKGDPNRAIAFEYELPGPNGYAGVGVEVQGGPETDGKPLTDDVSHYKYLTMQLYVTGVTTMRVEFISRGTGFKISSGFPEEAFKVSPGFNTYRIPLGSISQPSWVTEDRVSPKDVLKKLTAVSIVAFCQPCTGVKGTVVIDNLIFQN